MTSISNPAFDRTTEALQVASHFPESIKDRVILVTGVNKRGIGFTTAEAFAAQHPRTLILAGRSEIKIRECVEALGSWYPTVDIRPLLVDLSSQKSVRSAAATVLGWTDMPVVDVVINNAGIMRHGEGFDGPMPTSEDGIEDQFATNHLGHFLLTNLIMPKIIAGATATARAGGPTASSRIINISSSGTYLSPFRASDLGWQKPASQLPESERPNFTLMKNAGMQVDEDVAYIPTAAYGQSKTCNVLFSVGLNERLFAKYSILSLAAHPGDIKTELARYTDPDWLARAVKNQESAGLKHWKTQTQGASTTLVAACDPKLALPGSDAKGYFIADCQISRAPAYATHREEAEKLWRISEELVGEKFVL